MHNCVCTVCVCLYVNVFLHVNECVYVWRKCMRVKVFVSEYIQTACMCVCVFVCWMHLYMYVLVYMYVY